MTAPVVQPLDQRTRNERVIGLDRVIAVLACFAVASRFPVQQGLTLGVIAGVVLLPVWLTALWPMRGGRAVLVLGTLTPISGIVLTEFFRANHATNDTLMSLNTFAVVGLIGGIGAVVWARKVIGDAATAIAYGVGLIAAIPSHPIVAENIWKFNISVPVIVTILAICMLRRSKWLELSALLCLAVVSALNDSRSAGSMLLIAAALVLWQLLAGSLSTRSSTLRTLAVFGFTAVIGYGALQAFILEGWFGEAAAARSAAQIDQSGSLILGGRPEIGASTELLANNPMGFGSGTIPNLQDILVAKTGMVRLNYDPNNGYVENYMLGGGFEVHSLVGDFWLRFGVIGAALLVTVLLIIIGGTAHHVSRRQASGLLIYLAIQCCWDALFAPMFYTTLSTFLLGTALAFLPRRRARLSEYTLGASDFVSFRTP